MATRSPRSSTSSATENILLSLLAIFIPPIPVLIKDGCGGHFIVNLILTIITWIPGIFHALYIIWRPSRRERSVVDWQRQTGYNGRQMYNDNNNNSGYGPQGNQNGYYGPAPREGVVSVPVQGQSPPYQAAYPVQAQDAAAMREYEQEREKKEAERAPAWSEKQ